MEWLRAAYAEAPDPGALLEEPFTLKDLRELHEVVSGAPLMRDTFRRFIQQHRQLRRHLGRHAATGSRW